MSATADIGRVSVPLIKLIRLNNQSTQSTNQLNQLRSDRAYVSALTEFLLLIRPAVFSPEAAARVKLQGMTNE